MQPRVSATHRMFLRCTFLHSTICHQSRICVFRVVRRAIPSYEQQLGVDRQFLLQPPLTFHYSFGVPASTGRHTGGGRRGRLGCCCGGSRCICRCGGRAHSSTAPFTGQCAHAVSVQQALAHGLKEGGNACTQILGRRGCQLATQDGLDVLGVDELDDVLHLAQVVADGVAKGTVHRLHKCFKDACGVPHWTHGEQHLENVSLPCAGEVKFQGRHLTASIGSLQRRASRRNKYNTQGQGNLRK